MAKWWLSLCLLLIVAIVSLLLLSLKRISAILGGEPQEVLLAMQNVAKGKITTKFGQMAYEGSIYHSEQQMNLSLASLLSSIDKVSVSIAAQVSDVNKRSLTISTLTSTQQQST